MLSIADIDGLPAALQNIENKLDQVIKLLQNDSVPLDKPYYSIPEFASITGFGTDKIYKLIYDGKLKALQETPRGRYRIPLSEFQKSIKI